MRWIFASLTFPAVLILIVNSRFCSHRVRVRLRFHGWTCSSWLWVVRIAGPDGSDDEASLVNPCTGEAPQRDPSGSSQATGLGASGLIVMMMMNSEYKPLDVDLSAGSVYLMDAR